MARKPKFIQKAVPDDRKGVFKEKAEAAGMSTASFARQEQHAAGRLGREARLATTLMGLSHKPGGMKALHSKRAEQRKGK